MSTPVRTVALVLGLAGAAPSQSISGRFAPNPPAPGVPVTLTCTDATGQGGQLPSPCSWFTVHQGSQTGPIVQLGLACPSVLVPVAPNGTFQFTWNQRDDTGALVPPGTYWFEVRCWTPTFSSLQIDWFPVTILSSPTPALVAAGAARLGQVTPMQVQAPNEPGAVYATALAFTANAPVAVLGLQTNLDASLSFDFLVAPIGGLDAAGNSSGLGLAVPNVPAALHLGAHAQTLIFGAGGLQLTNSIAFTVVP